MTSSPDVVVRKDLAYAEDGRPLLWDVYALPTTGVARPAVLLLHGGGWRVGERGLMANAATAIARHGFVAIAPEYRLLGEAPWPAQLNDVRTALRAVRAQAGALGVNADQVFTMGFSAGGHLALMAAGAPPEAFPAAHRPHGDQSEAVAGVAAYFPVVNLGPPFGDALEVSGDQVAAVTPKTYAGRLPPTIIFSGDADPITPVASAVELHGAITAAGGVADLKLFSRLVHEFVALPGMLDLTIREAAEFFDRTVISKPAFDKALEDLKAWWADLMGRARANPGGLFERPAAPGRSYLRSARRYGPRQHGPDRQVASRHQQRSVALRDRGDDPFISGHDKAQDGRIRNAPWPGCPSRREDLDANVKFIDAVPPDLAARPELTRPAKLIYLSEMSWRTSGKSARQ